MIFQLKRDRLFTLVRWTLLLGILGSVSWEFYAHAKIDKVHPSVHALCPLGGLESLQRWIVADGATLGKIFSGTMGLFFVTAGLSLVLKRSFCGAICPLGTLQELSGNLGRLILRGTRIRPPAGLDRWLRLLKYPILALTLVMAWLTGTLWVQAFDPWPAYAHLVSPAELWPGYAAGLIVLLLSLALSFLMDRAFCAYLCPMGALTALLGLLSPFKARRKAEACVDCGLCDRACPQAIMVSGAGAVTDPECLSCGKCAAVCPAPGALEMGFGSKLRVPPFAAPLLAGLLFFGGVGLLATLGFDRTSGRQEASLRELAVAEGLTLPEFKAAYDLPTGLAPWTRAGAVQEAIPLATVARLGGQEPAALKAKLGLSADFPEDSPWGEALGQVSLAHFAELNGMEYESFHTMLKLPARLGPATSWKEAKREVERAISRLQREGAGAEESCESE